MSSRLSEVAIVAQKLLDAIYSSGKPKEVNKASDTKLAAIGTMLADLDSDPQVWKEVKANLHLMIQLGDLTIVQVRVIEIAYGQVEIARKIDADRERVAGEVMARDKKKAEDLQREERGAQRQGEPGKAPVTVCFGGAIAAHDKERKSKCTQFGEVKVPFGGPGAALVVDYKTNRPMRCRRFPSERCTAGVPPGHYSGYEGMCMFAHYKGNMFKR
jgi:hypothetical protein